MADVTGLRANDRAQLFLVGALALAVIFVVLAVLLNTAIYTGNIATRDPGPGTTDVVEYENAAAAMADRTLADVNTYNNSSYTDLDTTFRDTVAVWSDTANVHSVTSLADANVSTVGTVHGTKIGQNHERNFTAADGTDNWTVANDSRARAFRMNVSQSSLVDIANLTDSFYVAVDDGETEFRAYVMREGTDNVTVEVRNATADTQVGTCTADTGADDHVLVEPTAARLGGTECPAFEWLFGNLSAPYDIRFHNAETIDGETINGTYQVIVDRPIDKLQTGADTAGGSAPYAAPALYSAELQVSYRSSVTYYRNEVRVVPGESDA